MRVLIALMMFAVSLQGALTTVNPPPGIEGDTLAIITNLFPDYIRLDDDLDQTFRGFTGDVVFAWEDDARGHGDFDYNDLIMHATFDNGLLTDWYKVAGFTVATQDFQYDSITGIARNDTSIGTVWSVVQLNPDMKDHMITLVKPVLTSVPEPSAVGLFVLGLFGMVAVMWRKRDA